MPILLLRPRVFTLEGVAPEPEPETPSGGGTKSQSPGKRGDWENTRLKRKPERKRKRRHRKKKTEQFQTQAIDVVNKLLQKPTALDPDLLLRQPYEVPVMPEPILTLDLYNSISPPTIFGLPSQFGGLPPQLTETLDIPPRAPTEYDETRQLLAALDPEFLFLDEELIAQIHHAIYDD